MSDSSTSSSDIEDLKNSLAHQFKLDISKLEEIRAQRERERQEEHERKSREHQAKLDAMLELQVKEAEERQKRREFWMRFVLGPTGVLSVVVGGIVAYLQATKPELTPEEKAKAAVQAGDVVEKVEQEGEQIEQRFQKIEASTKLQARELVQQKVQISDGFEHIGKKIDAAHPRQADEVEKPDSLDSLKKRVDKIKESEVGKKLLKDEEDELDPLVELAEGKK